MPSILGQNKYWMVFSDLDGTLLDEKTYSFTAAVPGLEFLAGKQIPIIPCTSKTAEEVTEICKDMNLAYPFIVENGSAVYIPKNYFKEFPDNLRSEGSNYVQILGKTYNDVLSFFKKIKKNYNLPARGFSEMSLSEIGERTGLDIKHSHYAKNRGFSEPFILTENHNLNPEIIDYAQAEGYRILKGNRFYHLLGDTDKGKALRAVCVLFERNLGRSFATIGIGDSPNDWDMLRAVDWPVLVKKQNGRYSELDPVKNLFRTEGIGPLGWQEAIFKILKSKQII